MSPDAPPAGGRDNRLFLGAHEGGTGDGTGAHRKSQPKTFSFQFGDIVFKDCVFDGRAEAAGLRERATDARKT